MQHIDKSTNINNPFTVISPEKLDAETAEQLFVEVFSDFPQVKNPGHSMIIGARGSGKSMIFRCLLPDVLQRKEGLSFGNLEFLAFHVPIKNTQLQITDLQRLDQNHASFLINEHFLTVSVMIEVLQSLATLPTSMPFIESTYQEFHDKIYARRLRLSGDSGNTCFCKTSVRDFFAAILDHALDMHSEFIRYILQISPELDVPAPAYNLPLLSFHGFVVPFLKGLKELPGFPKTNVYLFIDDADNLSKTQTQILNAWLATRTQPEISIKVSAQIGKYKSYSSPNGTLVESPHDYQEINISDRYTTSKTVYFKRVREVIEKRLLLSAIKRSPEEYFPVYEKQEISIQKEEERLRLSWAMDGRGNRPGDDVLRYARPNYIRELGVGGKKSRSTYMYAGFEQLVHLSSGVIRYFLDSAASMFDEARKERGETLLHSQIPCDIQDHIAREQADKMLFSQFRKFETDTPIPTVKGELGIVQKLQNLIFSMGQTFHDILISNRSERRVFSLALSNTPTEEIKQVLDFGVQTGYLHMATIGNKDGSGRTWLYILNRCLAPHFVLDPTGFAGYLFVTNDNLRLAMHKGKKLRDLTSRDEPEQLTLFD